MANRFATKARAAMVVLLAGSTLATAIPANAQYYDRRDHDRHDRHGRHDGISAGDVIAGAIVIGGLAAILSSGGNRDRNRDRDRNYDPRYDNRYDGYDWDRNGGSREAIERCVNAVERRGGHRDVDVRRITNIDRIRGGYQIAGNVAVDYRGRGGDWRDHDRYDRGRYDDRDGYGRDGHGRGGYDRGWDRDERHRYDDRGRFTCTVRYGRVEDVDFRGI